MCPDIQWANTVLKLIVKAPDNFHEHFAIVFIAHFDNAFRQRIH